MRRFLARYLLALALSFLWAAGVTAQAVPGDHGMAKSAAPTSAAEVCADMAPDAAHAATMSCAPVCASLVCAVLTEPPSLVVPAEPSHVTVSRPVSRDHVSRPEPYPPRVAALA